MNLLKYMQILSFVLPVAFLSCSNDTIEDVHYTPQTKIGQKLLAGSETVARVYTDTSFVVALGVTETDVHFQFLPFSHGFLKPVLQPLYSYIYNRH